MIKNILVKTIGLEKNGKVFKFVDGDIFNARKNRISVYDEPCYIVDSEDKLKKVKFKLSKKNSFQDYNIVLADYVVTIDLSLIYADDIAIVTGIAGDRVYVSNSDGSKRGYQYFNNDACILNVVSAVSNNNNISEI